MTYELLDTLQYLICCEELDDPKGGGEPVMFIFQATGEGWFRTTKGWSWKWQVRFLRHPKRLKLRRRHPKRRGTRKLLTMSSGFDLCNKKTMMQKHEPLVTRNILNGCSLVLYARWHGQDAIRKLARPPDEAAVIKSALEWFGLSTVQKKNWSEPITWQFCLEEWWEYDQQFLSGACPAHVRRVLAELVDVRQKQLIRRYECGLQVEHFLINTELIANTHPSSLDQHGWFFCLRDSSASLFAWLGVWVFVCAGKEFARRYMEQYEVLFVMILK